MESFNAGTEMAPQGEPIKTAEVLPEENGHYSEASLSRYFGTELSPENEHWIREHIKNCDTCRKNAEETNARAWENIKISGFD
jgi:hypothetical protein